MIGKEDMAEFMVLILDFPELRKAMNVMTAGVSAGI
jgi:hypothetical protein